MAHYSLLQMPTTIQVSEKLKRRLAKHKLHPRETYEAVIQRALNGFDEDAGLALRPEVVKQLDEAREHIRAGRGKTLQQYMAEHGL